MIVSARCSSVLGVDVELLFVAGSSLLFVGGPLVFALVEKDTRGNNRYAKKQQHHAQTENVKLV